MTLHIAAAGHARFGRVTLDRLMFRAIVPALLLPVIGAVVAILGTSNQSWDGGDGGPIMGLVVAVYLFVLLGSMTLNGWLLLRHPDSFALRTLPRRTALLLALLYGLLVVWIVLLALGIVGVAGFLFGGAIAALSIVSCVDAVVRRIQGSAGVAIASIGLSVSARVIGITYVVIAALAVARSAASQRGWTKARPAGFSVAPGLGG